MEAVYLVVNGVGLVLDVLTLVLDLNFLLVSSLLASLAWLLAFVYNLPHTVLTSLLHLGRGVLLSLLALIEAVIRFTCGGLQALCTLLYICCSGLESLKLLGHWPLTGHCGAGKYCTGASSVWSPMAMLCCARPVTSVPLP